MSETNLPTDQQIDEQEFISAAEQNQGFGREDAIIPFTKIMQPLSPEIGVAPGAVPGSFLNVATGNVIDGKTGMIVIPVMLVWNYTEWSGAKGEGGNLVKDWQENESGWKDKCDDYQRDAYQPVTKEGHVIQKARQFFIFNIDPETGDYDTSILSMSATGLKIARAWAAMMQHAPKVPTKNGPMTPAYFYYTYKIVSEEIKNQKGRWYQPRISYNTVNGKIQTVLDMPNGKALWRAAMDFRDSFRTGQLAIAAQKQNENDAEDANTI